jgi:hypothetical protein
MNKYARIDAIEQIDVLQYVRILDGIGHINILSTKCRNGVTKRPFTSQTFRFVTSSYENSLPRAASGKGTKRLLKVTDLLSCSISFHLLSSTHTLTIQEHRSSKPSIQAVHHTITHNINDHTTTILTSVELAIESQHGTINRGRDRSSQPQTQALVLIR